MLDKLISLVSDSIVTQLFTTPFKLGLTIIIIAVILWLLAAMHIFYHRKKPIRNLKWWIIQVWIAESFLWATTVFIGGSALKYEDIVLGLLTVTLVVITVAIHLYLRDKKKEYGRMYL